MKKRATKNIPQIGIDIGTRLIKALELSSKGDAPKIAKLDFCEIGSPPTEQKIKDALRSLLEKFKPSAKDVNISLSSPSAIVRFINMPKMKKEDLKKSLKFEAEKYIPFNIDEVNIDAFILDDVRLERNQMKVLLAAAKKDVLNSRLEIFKELGFSVSVIDVDSFACFNAFSYVSENLDDSKSIALLNIGYSQTNVLISQGRNPYFTRDVQIGGRDIAKALSVNLEVPESDADKFIIEPKDKGEQIFETSKTVLANLVEEIRLSFGYYENQYASSINEIYLSGGVARLAGIIGYLEEGLGLRPAAWDPFSKFETAPEVDKEFASRVKPQFAVSAGLALRGS